MDGSDSAALLYCFTLLATLLAQFASLSQTTPTNTIEDSIQVNFIDLEFLSHNYYITKYKHSKIDKEDSHN